MHQISNIYFVIKLYMFRAYSVPIIRSYLLTHGNWYVSCRLFDHLLAETGWNSSSGSIKCGEFLDYLKTG